MMTAWHDDRDQFKSLDHLISRRTLYPAYQMHQWINHGRRLGILTGLDIGDLLTDIVKRLDRSA
jgi:hypothetical protein